MKLVPGLTVSRFVPSALISAMRLAWALAVENAIVYNRAAGGWIMVETGPEAAGSWLRVCNSTPEVPEGVIAEIFEPFRRMQSERTATVTGVGLGLSIVSGIADVHDGAIDAGFVDGGGRRLDERL